MANFSDRLVAIYGNRIPTQQQAVAGNFSLPGSATNQASQIAGMDDATSRLARLRREEQSREIEFNAAQPQTNNNELATVQQEREKALADLESGYNKQLPPGVPFTEKDLPPKLYNLFNYSPPKFFGQDLSPTIDAFNKQFRGQIVNAVNADREKNITKK